MGGKVTQTGEITIKVSDKQTCMPGLLSQIDNTTLLMQVQGHNVQYEFIEFKESCRISLKILFNDKKAISRG